MSKFCIFNKESGEIIRIGNCPNGMEDSQILNITEGLLIGEVCDASQYIPDTTNPIGTNKPNSPVKISSSSLVVDELTYLTNIPNGSTISIFGEGVGIREELTVSEEDISFDFPGEYLLTIEAFPYLEYKVTINVT